jgi:VIT1/CCC1 family predicted Fe2+/Mn2+ transporter
VALLLVLPVAFDAISASGMPAAIYFEVFGVALPLLVYAFLTGGWTARVAMGMLR